MPLGNCWQYTDIKKYISLKKNKRLKKSRTELFGHQKEQQQQ